MRYYYNRGSAFTVAGIAPGEVLLQHRDGSLWRAPDLVLYDADGWLADRIDRAHTPGARKHA